MKRSTKFKLDVVGALAEAIEREIKKAELEFDDLKPEDFKDPETRVKYGDLMLAMSEVRQMLKTYTEVKEIGEKAFEKADEEEDGKKGGGKASRDYDKSIGFMKFKEAA